MIYLGENKVSLSSRNEMKIIFERTKICSSQPDLANEHANSAVSVQDDCILSEAPSVKVTFLSHLADFEHKSPPIREQRSILVHIQAHVVWSM